MASQLIEHERILTTQAKAEALQRYADRVITLGKKGTKHAYDRASSIMRTDKDLHKLFTTIALRYRERPGGYTRIIPAGFREHDAVQMAYIELVDRPGEFRPASRPVSQAPPLALPFAAAAHVHQQLQRIQQRRQGIEQHNVLEGKV